MPLDLYSVLEDTAKLVKIKKQCTIILIGIVTLAVEISASFVVTRIFIRFPPSETRLITIAQMETKISATLIGFMAIGLFYFLGVIHRFHDRFSQVRDMIYRNLTKTPRGRRKQDSMKGWADISLRFGRLLKSLNDFLIYSAVSSVVSFGIVIFLAVLAIDLLDTYVLSASLVCIIIGMSNVSFVLMSFAHMSNGLDELLNIAELRKSLRQVLTGSSRSLF